MKNVISVKTVTKNDKSIVHNVEFVEIYKFEANTVSIIAKKEEDVHWWQKTA